MKLIPEWAKGVSFLQKESGGKLTEGDGKPSGDGASRWGNLGDLTQAKTLSQDGLEECHSVIPGPGTEEMPRL